MEATIITKEEVNEERERLLSSFEAIADAILLDFINSVNDKVKSKILVKEKSQEYSFPLKLKKNVQVKNLNLSDLYNYSLEKILALVNEENVLVKVEPVQDYQYKQAKQSGLGMSGVANKQSALLFELKVFVEF